MYIFGDKSDFTDQIITLIADASIDAEQHIIGNAKEIISREPIVCLCTAADCEAIKCVIPYLNEKFPIIFIKQQWSNEELELVESTIQESLSTRKQLWLDEIKKLSSLQGRKAQKERVEKLNHWIDNTSVQYCCLSSSQIDFKNNLIKVLRRKAPIECIYHLITTVSQRPPSLHWTSLPQTDEAQITFKIAFPQSCFTRSELFELAKIAVIKHDPETLEMSGRIDNAIMDDNSDTVPMKSVWPYLSITLTVAVEYLDELSSQYIAKLKPKTIGEIGEMKAKSNNSTVKEENNSRNENVYLRLPERVHSNSCGRRVSFGTVKCIPQPSQKIELDVELDNVPNEKPTETQYEIMLDNYVDLILDETMREIRIS
ncbi:unnamed protein product [Onchocerca ochengi]|uniref:RWD domain-containing protein n=1 Tax=Onchocerca ochengi TaxID=42157 RepID=A0A182E354_ONCOC|nr:unnamed protein product [Onchocerca ochengi]